MFHSVVTMGLFGGENALILFDPNSGEFQLSDNDFLLALLQVVGEYSTNAVLHTLRYIRVEKGFEFENSYYY